MGRLLRICWRACSTMHPGNRSQIEASFCFNYLVACLWQCRLYTHQHKSLKLMTLACLFVCPSVLQLYVIILLLKLCQACWGIACGCMSALPYAACLELVPGKVRYGWGLGPVQLTPTAETSQSSMIMEWTAGLKPCLLKLSGLLVNRTCQTGT